MKWTNETMTTNCVDVKNGLPEFNYTVEYPRTMSKEGASWEQLTDYDPTLYVVASLRQETDSQWVVDDADWKIEIYSGYHSLYYSSYFNMKNYTMENGFWYDGERMTTGNWNFNSTVFKASERESE